MKLNLKYNSGTKRYCLITFVFILFFGFYNISAAAEYQITGDNVHPQYIVGDPGVVRLKGTISKHKTFNPRVLGGANLFVNNTGNTYRIVEIKWELVPGPVLKNESFETDITLTVLPENTLVSLDSGNEMLSTHSYYVYGEENHPIQSIIVPSGGFEFKPNSTLSMGSVSGLFDLELGGKEIEDQRLDKLMKVNFEILLKKSEFLNDSAVTSYRSPYRDRSYVPTPTRSHAPFTSWVNNSNNTIKIHGIGVFASNLTSTQNSLQSLEVSKNGEIIASVPLPPHLKGVTSSVVPMIIDFEIDVEPNDVITVVGKVDVDASLVYDFSAFVIADYGLEVKNERLNIITADINGDGYLDIIDQDANGSIWVSLAVANGLQDTGDEWLTSMPTNIKLSPPIYSRGKPSYLVATNSDGMCMNLKIDLINTQFVPNYCSGFQIDESNQYIWGDYNGDGFPDVMVVDDIKRTYNVHLGSKSGLLPSAIWSYDNGKVDKIWSWKTDGHNFDSITTEWNGQCYVFKSTGTYFEKESCNNLLGAYR